MLTYAAVASILGLIFSATIVLLDDWPFTNFSQGELRCEGAGAIVIRIAGNDYAVNGMARVSLGFFLPTLIGNVAGGTLLFAVLSYAQVREEIDEFR
jgi:hypothetical protein